MMILLQLVLLMALAPKGTWVVNFNSELILRQAKVPLSILSLSSSSSSSSSSSLGLFQNISSVSVVPKYIISSKLSVAIQVRQVDVTDTNQYLNLQPDQSRYFHYSNSKYPHMIQIRRSKDNLANLTDEDNDEWYGEVDVSKLGLVYAKLRDPLVVLKIQTQLVGASLVATISEQSYLWPPYRVLNSSQFGIRFRQAYKIQESMIERTLGD